MDTSAITSVDELEQVLGTPLPRVANKARAHLDAIDEQWIARSPFCLVVTSAADGMCDVSPKGDPSGFVHALDAATLAVPERPGNRCADGYRNAVGGRATRGPAVTGQDRTCAGAT